MRIDILTLFPEMFAGPFDASILKRARGAGIARIHVWDIRHFAAGRHRVADDVPYGGGAGMVMKPEPIFAAAEHVRAVGGPGRPRVILLSPQGVPLKQELVRELAAERWLLLLCGHYEGVDERVKVLLTDEISIGDYVLTGGELPAMVLVDAVVRLLPGALGEAASLEEESFAGGLLEYPHYTRPAVFRGMSVPEVLLSGHHERIRRWRRKEALRRTWERRPDLLARAALTEEDRRLLAEVLAEAGAGAKEGEAREGGAGRDLAGEGPAGEGRGPAGEGRGWAGEGRGPAGEDRGPAGAGDEGR